MRFFPFFFFSKQTKSAFYVMRTGLTNASIKRGEKTSQMAKRIAAVNTKQQPTQVSSSLPRSEAKYRQPIATSIRRFRRRLNCPTCYRSLADSYNLSPNTVCPKARLLFQLKPRRRETQICTGKELKKKKKKHHHLPPVGRAPSQFASRVDGASGRTRV